MFNNVRLELGIDSGTVTTVQFKTIVQVNSDGSEQRVSKWVNPLLKYQVGERGLLSDEIEYLSQFFEARKGSFEGFLFRDWGDYQAANAIGVGNNSETNFQLIKRYSIDDFFVDRPIFKPRIETLKVYLDGDLTTEFEVINGVVIFNNPPSINTVIFAEYEFDVPVRFSQDNINFRYVADGLYKLESLELQEVRFSPSESVNIINYSEYLNKTFNIGYDYDTSGGPTFSTSVYTISSGFEKRFSKWANPTKVYQLGNKSLLKDELNYLLAFFRVTKGSAHSFDYINRFEANNPLMKCRFLNDEFSYVFGTLVNNIGLWETNNYAIKSLI